jgi:hypothetical protein
MHDMDASAVVQLCVVQPFRRIELAMRTAGVVENLGENPHYMLVVVEDLVVTAAGSGVPLYESCASHQDQ